MDSRMTPGGLVAMLSRIPCRGSLLAAGGGAGRREAPWVPAARRLPASKACLGAGLFLPLGSGQALAAIAVLVAAAVVWWLIRRRIRRGRQAGAARQLALPPFRLMTPSPGMHDASHAMLFREEMVARLRSIPGVRVVEPGPLPEADSGQIAPGELCALLGVDAVIRGRCRSTARELEVHLALEQRTGESFAGRVVVAAGAGPEENARHAGRLIESFAERLAIPLDRNDRRRLGQALTTNALAYDQYRLAQSAASADNLAAAQAALEKAVAADGSFVEAHSKLGEVKALRGDPRGAVDQLQRTLEVDRTHVETHLRLGRVYELQNRHSEARHVYSQAASLGGGPDGRFLEAEAARRRGDLREAVDLYDKALRAGCRLPLLFTALKDCIADLNHVPGDLAPRLAAMLAAGEAGAEAAALLGVIRFLAGEFAAACEAFEAALAAGGVSAENHANHGECLRKLGRFEEATAAFHRALELEPHLLVGHINLGKTLQAQGRLRDALASYDAALLIDPSSLVAKALKSRLLASSWSDPRTT